MPLFGLTKEILILELLLDGPAYGLELVERSEGQLARGTVYVTLARLETKGWTSSKPPPAEERTSGLPRRRYSITAHGRRVLDAATMLAKRARGAR
jgi:DNA-binding PadR family transcriptional regulator